MKNLIFYSVIKEFFQCQHEEKDMVCEYLSMLGLFYVCEDLCVCVGTTLRWGRVGSLTAGIKTCFQCMFSNPLIKIMILLLFQLIFQMIHARASEFQEMVHYLGNADLPTFPAPPPCQLFVYVLCLT